MAFSQANILETFSVVPSLLGCSHLTCTLCVASCSIFVDRALSADNARYYIHVMRGFVLSCVASYTIWRLRARGQIVHDLWRGLRPFRIKAFFSFRRLAVLALEFPGLMTKSCVFWQVRCNISYGRVFIENTRA